MGPVALLTVGFILISFIWKKISEKIVFLRKSNIKYLILDKLADFIYYGDDIGVEASLALDSPSDTVLEKRKQGQVYLESKLSSSSGNKRGEELSMKLVDCRFRLAKVCMPLMRELEFPASRNFLKEVRFEDGKMIEVDSETCDKLMYVGNDAVHTLGNESFHKPIQHQINKRMAESDKMKFAPLSLNPELEKNVNMILNLTGMDQVRYSLSGSEAMDAAFKDIKASCRNKQVIVRFASAYHGHVSGVDYLNCKNHIFLKECSKESIEFIEKYHHRIAAVVVNPMQHFTGINKASPPGEKLTLESRIRRTTPRKEYAKWLHELQHICNYCTQYLSKVAFVLDDIYFAFRTPELFSKDYFLHPTTKKPLRPNVLVLGKGVAAGYPLSMVLGQKGYLNTYDKKYLLQVNKTVGTLSAWHGGIVASNVYLETLLGKNSLLKTPAIEQLEQMTMKFNQFTVDLNMKFNAENLPLRIRSFSNTFSIDYLVNSLYNSRYPQYLMAEGVYLGNYSTGKFNLNNDCSEGDLFKLADKFVNAGLKMRHDGFFETTSASTKKNLVMSVLCKSIKTNVVKFYTQIMQDKHIDIQVSHNHPVNKFGHFWSSVFMILMAYPSLFIKGDILHGCMWFFLTHVVRQSGHFFYEHQDRDIEKMKFGHKDRSKKEAVVALIVAATSYHYRSSIYSFVSQFMEVPSLTLDQYVLLVCLFTIVPHFVEIWYQFGFLRSFSWLVKILTDPFTDIIDFYSHWLIHPKYFLEFKDHNAVYRLDIKTATVTTVDTSKPKRLD